MNNIEKLEVEDQRKSVIKKVIDTIFSVEVTTQFDTISSWIDKMYADKSLSSCEYYLFHLLLEKHIEQFDKNKRLQCSLNDDVDNNEIRNINRDFSRFAGQIIFDYFTNEESGIYKEKVFCNVYDLPLNINLIKSDVVKGEITVYLQKPGRLIGKAGRTIDELTEVIRKKTEIPYIQILIVETFGRTEIRYDY